jgi:hypothetical protein
MSIASLCSQTVLRRFSQTAHRKPSRAPRAIINGLPMLPPGADERIAGPRRWQSRPPTTGSLPNGREYRCPLYPQSCRDSRRPARQLRAISRHLPPHSIATSSARPNGTEMVSRCASTVQSLAFRQASQVFGIGGGSAPIRREKSPRGATSPPSR